MKLSRYIVAAVALVCLAAQVGEAQARHRHRHARRVVRREVTYNMVAPAVGCPFDFCPVYARPLVPLVPHAHVAPISPYYPVPYYTFRPSLGLGLDVGPVHAHFGF